MYRSEDSGEHWERLDSPMNEIPIWALAIDPVDPNIIFAGTRPAALFRSTDGGQHWDKLSVQIAEECPNVGIPRVTALVVDPVDHQHIWAGLEVDGVRHSKDGGKSWEAVTSGVTDPDIHNLAITVGPPKTLLTVTPREIFSSTDNGATWEPVQVRSQVSIPYCRGVLVKADDPQVIYLGNGESAFGGLGALHRSPDRGQTWETLPLPLAPNGTIWNLATHVPTPIFCWPVASTVRSSAAPTRAIPGASLPGNLARCMPSSGCRTSAWPQCSRKTTSPRRAPGQLRPKAVTVRAVRRDSRPYRCGTWPRNG